MGIFDGVLFCSDIDETLTSGGILSKKNCDSIRYFQQNGGLFTLSTGRHPDFIKNRGFDIKVNTSLVTINGTVICDEEGKNILYCKRLEAQKVKEVVEFVTENFKINNFRSMDAENCEIKNRISKLPQNKLVFVTADEQEAIKVMNNLNNKFVDKISVSRSWNTGVEVIPKGSGKGVCVKKLKEITRSKLLICVGDYENDIDMLKSADIGYAVGNAADCVKKAADRVTVKASDDAIAEIIRITENELRNI